MHCSAPLAHPAAVLHRFVAPMWQWRNSMMDGCGVKITKQPNGTFLAEEGQFVNDEWVSRGPRRCAEGGWWRGLRALYCSPAGQQMLCSAHLCSGAETSLFGADVLPKCALPITMLQRCTLSICNSPAFLSLRWAT